MFKCAFYSYNWVFLNIIVYMCCAVLLVLMRVGIFFQQLIWTHAERSRPPGVVNIAINPVLAHAMHGNYPFRSNYTVCWTTVKWWGSWHAQCTTHTRSNKPSCFPLSHWSERMGVTRRTPTRLMRRVELKNKPFESKFFVVVNSVHYEQGDRVNIMFNRGLFILIPRVSRGCGELMKLWLFHQLLNINQARHCSTIRGSAETPGSHTPPDTASCRCKITPILHHPDRPPPGSYFDF